MSEEAIKSQYRGSGLYGDSSFVVQQTYFYAVPCEDMKVN